MRDNLFKNKAFGHFLSTLFFIVLGAVFFFAASNMNYTWQWTGVSKYFVYEKKQSVISPINGIVQINKNEIIIKSNFESANLSIPKDYTLSVKQGDTIFQDDAVATKSSLSAGPLLNGLYVTIQISIVSTLIAFFIAIIITFMRMSSIVFLNDIGSIYVTVIRGTPLLVQIFIFYYIIANFFGFDRFLAGALSLGFFCGAYIAEVLRGAIQSIDKGQLEAAKSLGMNTSTAMLLIIFPQALKRALPALIGEIIALIKDSSLVSAISITDLTKAGKEIISNTFAPFETWIIIAIMYFFITFVLSIVGNKLEKRMKTKGGF